MLTLKHHIAARVLLFLAVVLACGLLSTPALADKAKKNTAKPNVSASAIRLSSPTLNAADIVVNALGQRSQKQTPKTSLTADTARGESKILFVRATSDVVTVKVDIANDQPSADIGIFNMLGKRMMDVHRGPVSRGEHEYTSSISDLPEGVYICILQGSNFRRAEKFYLSR